MTGVSGVALADPSSETGVPDGRRDTDLALAALTSLMSGIVFDSARVAYVSTPITTGHDLYRSLAMRFPTGIANAPDNEVQSVRSAVMERNAARARSTMEAARTAKTAEVFVDPSELSVPGWSQRQYLNYWLDFIDKYVDIVVLAPGWEYSTGSTAECFLAMKKNLPVLDHNMHQLNAHKAHGLISTAIQGVESLGFDAGSLVDIKQEFERNVSS